MQISLVKVNFLATWSLFSHLNSQDCLECSPDNRWDGSSPSCSCNSVFPGFIVFPQICAEQDGGPAHRRSQPVGYRLSGPYSWWQGPSNRRVEETSDGEAAAGQAPGWGRSEEKGDVQSNEHICLREEIIFDVQPEQECHTWGIGCLVLVWKTLSINLMSATETQLINQEKDQGCLHGDVSPYKWNKPINWMERKAFSDEFLTHMNKPKEKVDLVSFFLYDTCLLFLCYVIRWKMAT